MHLPSLLRLSVPTVAVLALALAPVALAAKGSPQLQTFFQSNFTHTGYQQKVFNKVAKAWKQPGPKQVPQVGKKTVVQAVIGKDGKLVSAELSLESGSKAWDAAALAAVKKAAPFDPLPASHGAPTVEVHFHVAWVAGG